MYHNLMKRGVSKSAKTVSQIAESDQLAYTVLKAMTRSVCKCNIYHSDHCAVMSTVVRCVVRRVTDAITDEVYCYRAESCLIHQLDHCDESLNR